MNTQLTAAFLSFLLAVSPAAAQTVSGPKAPARIQTGAFGISQGPAATGLSLSLSGAGFSPTLTPSLSPLPALTPAAPQLQAPAASAPSAQPVLEAVQEAVEPEAVARKVMPIKPKASGAPEKIRPPIKADKPGLLARLAEAIGLRQSPGKIFDSAGSYASVPMGAMGIRELPAPKLPEGVVLDPAPTIPEPTKKTGVTINSFNIPGVVTADGMFEPKVLDADPTSEAELERAMRALVDADVPSFGVASKELATVHVKRVEGKGDQADTVYGYFRQQKNGVPIHGSYLSFTAKVLGGKAVVLATMARLYTDMPANTTPAFTDDEMRAKVYERIGLPAEQVGELDFIERKIIYSGGAWRTVNLYVIPGLPFMIAVDVANGEVFAWDARLGKREADLEAQSPTTLKVEGRGEAIDTRPNGQSVLTSQPLPHLIMTLPDGKKIVTDRNGRFSSDTLGDKPVTFTATLTGKYNTVIDRAGKPLQVPVTLIPGQEAQAVFNPEGQSEFAVSQVNAYRHPNVMLDWSRDNGLSDARLERHVPDYVNIDDECNAYYTPGRPSRNFFKSSADCSDTARPGVIYHENGHNYDDAVGGIQHGGLSEAIGDVFSMFILESPIIGDGFLKKRNPSYIRHGDNNYQYRKNDEVHDQGQAFMGFAWKLRTALKASMGEAAKAFTNSLVLQPALFAKAADIPAAMAQVLLNDMDKQGRLPHEKEIRAAAKAHGVELPKNPGGFIAAVRESFSFSGVSLDETFIDGLTPGRVQSVAKFVGGDFSAGEAKELLRELAAPHPESRGTFTLKAGRSVRGALRQSIEQAYQFRPGDYGDLRLDIREKKGLFSSTFQITLEGRKKAVDYMARQLERLSGKREVMPGKSYEFSSGLLLRGTVAQVIQEYGEESGLKYELHEERGVLYSDFKLVVDGPPDQVDQLIRRVEAYLDRISDLYWREP